MDPKVLWNLFALAVSLAVVVYGGYCWIRRAEDPRSILYKLVLSLILFPLGITSVLWAGVAGMPILILCCIAVGALWAPHMGAALAKPITGLYDGGTFEVERRASYEIATARIKQGRYQEAIAEIHKQLEEFPENGEGLLLLASIYADHLKKLPEALEVIERILANPNPDPTAVALGLNRAADWQLKLARDIPGARQALEKILELYPGTEAARHAGLRIAHLPSEEFMRGRAEPTAMPLPQAEPRLGLVEPAPDQMPKVEDATETVQELYRHLQIYPDDTEAREKLALVCADQLQRLDLARAEIERLLASPNQPLRQQVRWLNHLADFEIKLGGDYEAARNALQRIMNLCPKSAAAEQALNRISYLKLELRRQGTTQPIRLGEFEQNVGLKMKGRPRPGSEV